MEGKEGAEGVGVGVIGGAEGTGCVFCVVVDGEGPAAAVRVGPEGTVSGGEGWVTREVLPLTACMII